MPITGRILGVGLLLAAAVSTGGRRQAWARTGLPGAGPSCSGSPCWSLRRRSAVWSWSGGASRPCSESCLPGRARRPAPANVGAQGLAFVRDEPTLQVLAEIGVLILLFDVGLESDLRAFAPTLCSR